MVGMRGNRNWIDRKWKHSAQRMIQEEVLLRLTVLHNGGQRYWNHLKPAYMLQHTHSMYLSLILLDTAKTANLIVITLIHLNKTNRHSHIESNPFLCYGLRNMHLIKPPPAPSGVVSSGCNPASGKRPEYIYGLKYLPIRRMSLANAAGLSTPGKWPPNWTSSYRD